MEEEIKQLIDLLKSLNKTRVLITGHPNSIETIKVLIDERKEMFSKYDFSFYSSSEFEDGNLYLVPEEDRTKSLFDMIKITYSGWNEEE